MRRQFFFACAFVLLGSPYLSAQQVLPVRFGAWQPGSRPAFVFWPRSPGGAASSFDLRPAYEQTLVESGVVRVEEYYYQKDANDLAIRLYKLRDPSSAYEVYTSLLRSGMMPARLGQVAAFDRDGVLILVGSLVLSSSANVSRDDLNALVKAVEASSGMAPLPPIPSYLPGPGRLLGTERYALGPAAFRAAVAELGRPEFAALADAAGFNSGAETMLARYQSGNGAALLLLIDYPTPQLAELHLRHLQVAMPESDTKMKTAIERKGSLLVMVLAPSSAAYAESLRNAVNHETQVTWNEPTHTLTDPPWTSVIAKIFIGTGVFMVAAVVLGIAFGGVRVVTKRLFPGKVFDRPERMEILQLGLSGKRIDPSDFY